MSLEVKTNNVPRDILYPWDLTKKEAEEFDYLDLEGGEGNFVRYKGYVYYLGDFVRIVPPGRKDPNPWTHKVFDENSPLLKWDGIRTDSFFSAVVVRYANDNEQVVVGLALS